MEKEAPKAGSETNAIAIIEHLFAGGEELPEQVVVQSHWSQEKALAAAVLMDALIEVRDYHRDPSYGRKVSEDLEWIFSDDAEWPFSFVNLCAVFGLEPACVRRIVWGWLIGRTVGYGSELGVIERQRSRLARVNGRTET